MNFLYNTGIRLYSAAARIASLRSRKVATMLEGQSRSLTTLRKRISPADHPLWIHVASLGEFEQARPLIERLRRERPDLKIVLSFFSPSGYEVRKNYDKVDCVVYLPFDTPANAREVIDAINPSMVIFVKYEFWGNYLQELSRRGIPTYIISAIFRPSQAFFKPWGGMMRDVLRCFTHLYVQDQASAELLAGIGIDNVTVCGDTRFDRVTDVMKNPALIPGISMFNPRGGGADMIFGSSWPADEEKYVSWLNSHPEAYFIIAPHEFDDKRLRELRDSITGEVLLLSEWQDMMTPPSNGSCGLPNPYCVRGIIVDSFGKLSTLYKYAKIAYIGGGFGVGIHNINEAAVYGIPVVFGPNYHKFKEARDLIELGGAFPCNDAGDVCHTLSRLYGDKEERTKAGEAAGKYIADNLGATDRIFSDLFS